MELWVDADRFHEYGESGIFVRARSRVDKWESVDIVDLKKKSLKSWLKSLNKNGVEDVVGILLGHGHLNLEE